MTSNPSPQSRLQTLRARIAMALDVLRHGPLYACTRFLAQCSAPTSKSSTEVYETVAVMRDGTRVPVDASELEIFLGNDAANRPLYVRMELTAATYGHRGIYIHSSSGKNLDLKSTKPLDMNEWTTLEVDETASNYRKMSVRYDDDRRDDSEVNLKEIPQTKEYELRALTEENRQRARYEYSHEWDGVTQAATMKFGWSKHEREWFHVLQAREWPSVLTLLEHGANPNEWRLSGVLQNTALHWAAEYDAPVEVVNAMIELGGWRNIRNATGDIPYDIALRKGHTRLLEILQPVILHPTPVDALAAIQTHFHTMLRWPSYIEKHQLRRPELGPLLELEEPQMVFRVPGMYGGYTYWLDKESSKPQIIIESRSRVVGGAVPRFEIDADGSRRVTSVNEQ